MQITRNHHLRYMSRLTPCLIALYLVQVFLYQRFAPEHLSSDMNIILGLGLALIIVLYHFYDQHHKIILKENYLEARFDLLKIKEEILYQNITDIEIRTSRFSYGKVTLHTRDGATCELHHVDSPELIKEYINRKRTKNFS